MRDRDYHLGVALVASAALAWSTAGLFTRMIELDIATMLVWRGVFGALGILAIGAALQGRRMIRDFARMGVPGWTFAVISALGMVCFIAALRLTTVAHVSFIYATVPFVAGVLGWCVMRERPTRSAVVASTTSLLGVALIVGLGVEGDIIGDLLALGMTVALAGMMVISRRFRDIPIMPAACVSAILSGALALPFAAGLAVDPPDLRLLAAFGLVNSALGLALFTLGARLLPAVETALIGALETPLAPAWVWIFFAEVPSVATGIGGTVVMAAVLGHILYQSRVDAATGGIEIGGGRAGLSRYFPKGRK